MAISGLSAVTKYWEKQATSREQLNKAVLYMVVNIIISAVTSHLGTTFLINTSSSTSIVISSVVLHLSWSLLLLVPYVVELSGMTKLCNQKSRVLL